MSFDWKEHLSLAEEISPELKARIVTRVILPAATRETKLRATINRSYYSAFCYARAYLETSKGIRIRKSGAHTEVIREYNNMTSREAKQIGTQLGRLFDDRKKADYDDAIPNLDCVTELALIRAHKIIKNVDVLI